MHRTICMAALLALALFLPVGASAQGGQGTSAPPSVHHKPPPPSSGFIHGLPAPQHHAAKPSSVPTPSPMMSEGVLQQNGPNFIYDYPAPTQALGPNDLLLLQQSTSLGRTQPYASLPLSTLAAYLGTGGGTCKALLNMSGQPILNMSNQQIFVGC